jgi:hypothetical protein
VTEKRKSASPADSLTTAPGTSAITPTRMEDIAVEVDRLCGAVRKVMPLLACNDEPARFHALLDRKAR